MLEVSAQRNVLVTTDMCSEETLGCVGRLLQYLPQMRPDSKDPPDLCKEDQDKMKALGSSTAKRRLWERFTRISGSKSPRFWLIKNLDDMMCRLVAVKHGIETCKRTTVVVQDKYQKIGRAHV